LRQGFSPPTPAALPASRLEKIYPSAHTSVG
jgi:hypothetical protein